MTSMKKFSIVVASSKDMGIGKGGKLMWKLPQDMTFFKTITSTATVGKNAVIMGRKTWESIPEKFRPLDNRLNVVLSKNEQVKEALQIPSSVLVETSLPSALATISLLADIDRVFVIGGEQLYREAMADINCDTIYLTSVECNCPDADAFLPPISAENFRLIKRSPALEENGFTFRFQEYKRNEFDDQGEMPGTPTDTTNHEEMQYLRTIDDIMRTGVVRSDRTGTGTISKFGVMMRYDLRNNKFPLLTTKRVFWRGVAEELLWFVKGCTNANVLADQNIHIWDGNGSREFLDNLGLTEREVGDLGPVYGFQWRHFGATYETMHSDYTGKGIDQLAECIRKIKNSPEDRRIVLTAWNPSDLTKMALPPCHMFCQFYVANGELSCQMYQRSADMGLGVPFNIASYALLTRLVAQVCGLKPGDFVHTLGDAHVYSNHVEALTEQLKRTPKAFPTLSINPAVTDIDGFSMSDFTMHDYTPHATIKMKMAV